MSDELYRPDWERELIGALLCDPSQRAECNFDPEDLGDPKRVTLVRMIDELLARGEYVDTLAVRDALAAHNYDPDAFEIESMAADVLSVYSAPNRANQVHDLAARRRVLPHAQDLLRIIYQSNGTWREDLATAAQRVTQLTARPAARPARVTSWTAAELLAAQFPDPVWVVPDLITVGLTLLAGRPKVGKSWLALQTAIAVGAGGMVLDRRVKQGKVLYLALEDDARRLQNRGLKQGMPSTATIRFELAWPLLTDGGIDALDAAVREHGYSFVVVDTIGRALGRADTQDWADMNTYVGALQEFAHARDIAVLCLDHHRKPTGFVGDPVDDLVGTTAKSAVADCLIGLYKEQGRAGAKLSVRGRDIEDQEWALTWDRQLFCWQYAGTVAEAALQGNVGRVVDALRNSDAPMTLTELAETTGIGKNNLQPILVDMTNNGVLERLPKQGRDTPYRLRVAG